MTWLKRTALVGVGAAVGGGVFELARRARQGTPEAVGGHGGPVSSSARATRTAELARMGARAGANYASFSARSVMASEDRKVELRQEFELRTAEQVAQALGNMKGALMKLGQMASYLDQGLPEPVREALAELQSNAPPMSIELVRSVIRAELGAEPEEIFESFDPVPLASASIGQVHRAVTTFGHQVAVKVQYPGVDSAIRADLDNTDLLFGALGMLFPGLDPAPIVAELRLRILEELDYRNEARNQTIFAEYYEGHPTISVPRVHPELSTGRVLTTAFADGVGWAEMLTWSEAERNLAAETIYRYAFTGIYRLGIFNGDPHPGNYLFSPGGRVAFLDYGLCRQFTPDEVTSFAELIQAMVIDGDVSRFRKIMDRLGFLTKADRFSDAEVGEYMRHFYELLLSDEPLEVTPEYASEMVRRYFDLSGPYAEIIRSINLPGYMVIVQRINLGLIALLAELDATANWRQISEEIWPFVDRAPSTPMGERIAEWQRDTGHSVR